MRQTYAEVVKTIPAHLRQYVVDQDYSRYTPLDQATWRFSLRQLKNFLSKNAYDCYSEGLEKTGIKVREIPRIDLMCEKLQEFGWYAIPVSGFIPPAAFMELQSLSILPIASDMRTIDHILYTPAPDIVHEAAGHAPILVDEKFANYLKSYAQVAKKAIISSEDLAQYEAIRDLSDIKENPTSTSEQIKAAEKKLTDVNAAISHVSEAALLGRMNWWTAEYGLIGDLKSPKIFGAGLLSSVGEARSCLTSAVEKIPLSVDCVDTTYDITEKQPQLFVAKSFDDLGRVLKDLENRLAFRLGGAVGLERAKKAKTVNTVQLNSGLQISGQVIEFSVNGKNQPYYVRFQGPTQISFDEKQLEGHGADYHKDGYSTPVGFFKGIDQDPSSLSTAELEKIGLKVGEFSKLEMESGIVIEGILKSEARLNGKLVLLAFEKCLVKNGEKVLFLPDWGTFDMAIASTVTSVFGGPADREAYGVFDAFVPKIIPRKAITEMEKFKHGIYQKIRDMREGTSPVDATVIEQSLKELKSRADGEWLAFLEIHELSFRFSELEKFKKPSLDELQRIRAISPEKAEYIDLGLELADQVI